ncbi:MAG: MFS transporter [Bacteroidetes bacterium]|nr:MFS transporter [Bacteroidota bacterium]
MKMKSGEFIALSACTMALTALGIDIMLPAFAEIRHTFGLPSNSTATANIVSYFFMGQVAQIVFGILSDRYGRLAILRVGFPLYIISGLVAAFAPSLTLMFVARFVMGMGASAVFMSTIAGVRDRYVGDQMARIMSLIFTIFLFTPVIAPFLGVILLQYTSWKMVFLTPPLFALLVLIWSLRLEESLPPDKRSKLNWKTIGQSIKSVLSDPIFLRYTTITTLLFSALSSYVAGAERIIGEIYGKPNYFAWIFGGMGLIMSGSSLLNSRLSIKYGAKKTMRRSLIIYTIVASLLLLINFIMGDPPPMIYFFIPVVILLALNLAIEPNSSALAMEPMGDKAGLASSVYGTIFFFIGGFLGAIISHFMNKGVSALITSFFVVGIISLLIAFTGRRT